MKKLFTGLGILLLVLVTTAPPTQEQDPITLIIRAGIIKAIKALDLQIQRLQNRTIWLQNAQKVMENTLSLVKLAGISDREKKQRQLYQDYCKELKEVKSTITYYQRIREITQKQVRLVEPLLRPCTPKVIRPMAAPEYTPNCGRRSSGVLSIWQPGSCTLMASSLIGKEDSL